MRGRLHPREPRCLVLSGDHPVDEALGSNALESVLVSISCPQESINTDWKSIILLDGVAGGPSKSAYETRIINKKKQLKRSLPRTRLYKTENNPDQFTIKVGLS